MTLSPGAKVQPKRSTLRSPAGFKRLLQFDVERAGADAAAVHRAQHLDVADGIETEALRDAGLYQFDECAARRSQGSSAWHKVEVAVALGPGKIRNDALVYPVRVGDDLALALPAGTLRSGAPREPRQKQ